MSKKNTAIQQDFTMWLRNAATVVLDAYDSDRNKVDLSAKGVSTIKWIYAESEGDDPIVEKTMSAGEISIIGSNNDQVEVTLDVADLDPSQVAVEPDYEYYHELKIEDWTSTVGTMTTRPSST